MKVQGKYRSFFTFTVALIIVLGFGTLDAAAQKKDKLIRLAKLQIDSVQLENYKSILKEGIEAALRLEPGVLTLYAVSEKAQPNHITILEIYADEDAYRAHLETPHFKKYKTGTKDMVKSLELVEVDPLIPGLKVIK